MMQKIIQFILISIFSVGLHASEEKFLSFAYHLPLMFCYSPEYRACYDDVAIEQCALSMKRNRDKCLDRTTSLNYSDSVKEYTICMIFSHAGAESFEDIKNPCLIEKGMNINMTKNARRIMNANQDWVENLLD